jgi:hypothetical protein
VNNRQRLGPVAASPSEPEKVSGLSVHHLVNKRRLSAIIAFGLGTLFAVCGVIAWAVIPGPHMDTAFEYQRLLDAGTYPALLRLVAQDNQPPVSATLFWVLFQAVSSNLALLRITIGILMLLLILVIAGWAMHRPTWLDPRQQSLRVGGERWFLAMAALAFIFGVSPAIAPVLVLLRYSTLLLVAWFAVFVLQLKVHSEPSSRGYSLLGFAAGLTLLISFSAAALLFTILVVTALLAPRRLLRTLLFMVPGGAAAVLWVIWAGPNFAANVADRSTSATLTIRSVSGKVFEIIAWPIVGPASLPSAATVLILVGGWVVLGFSLFLATKKMRKVRVILIANLAVPIIMYSLVGLNNGSMAGPTLALLTVFSCFLVSTPWVPRSRRLVALALLGMMMAGSTGLTWAGVGVLRPVLWSNAAPKMIGAVRSYNRGATLYVDGGDFGTALLLNQAKMAPILTGYIAERNIVDKYARVVVIRGVKRQEAN